MACHHVPPRRPRCPSVAGSTGALSGLISISGSATTLRDADFTGSIFVLLSDPPDSRDAKHGARAPTTRASADVRGVENVALEPHRSLQRIATAPARVKHGFRGGHAGHRTVNVTEAGVASVFPTASRARTRKVWVVRDRVLVVRGDVQFCQLPLSTWHWKVEPVSVATKPNVGVRLVVEADAPFTPGPEVSTVSGGWVSQALPMPSPLASAWLALATSGQLSAPSSRPS